MSQINVYMISPTEVTEWLPAPGMDHTGIFISGLGRMELEKYKKNKPNGYPAKSKKHGVPDRSLY